MPFYTRELNLDTETENRLVQYMIDELYTHRAERTDHLHDLMRWQKDYWAKPAKERATFPYHGASTLVVPLDAIAIESIHARNMTTRFALPHFVSAHSVADEWEDAAAPFERFFNRELIDVMKIRRTFGDCYLEATKFGTQIGKVGYVKMVRTSVRNVGDSEEEFDVTVRDGAQFDSVPDARFLMPHHARDPQTAPWCGEEHSETPYQIMQMEAGGVFRPGTIIDGPDWETDPTQISKLHSWINRTMNQSSPAQGNEFEQAQERLEGTVSQWPKRIDWIEMYLGFNVDKSPSGRLKEIVVHLHEDSRTIMSCKYNWYSDLRRPYRTGPHFPVEHRWRGIGVCKMNEQFQREITVQHRQRIDNATLANMRMIKIHKLSGYGPKEPVFPGKMWFLDDMTHIDTIQLGEIYPSSYNNEQASLIYSQQRLGVNELNQGMPQAGTPGTATSDLARIQEGNKKHDFIYDNYTEFTEEIILDIADVIQQFGPRQVTYFDTASNGKRVKQLLSVPQGYLRDGLILKLKASTQQQNQILDRQNWVQLGPLFTQYYEGLLQLAMQGGMQDLELQIILKGMNAATEAMRQVLETYDIPNIDRLIVKEIEDMVRNGLKQLGNQPPGGAGPPNASTDPRMGLIAQGFSAAGRNGNGVPNGVPNA